MSQNQSLSLSLAGKVAIVTGSGRENGIGAAIALALARAGAKVAINYVSGSSTSRAEKVLQGIHAATGREDAAISVRADISTPAGAKELVKSTLAGLGVENVDILVNNAAAGTPGPAMATRSEDIQKAFSVCVYGPLYMTQAAVPHMSRGGRIINTGSVASKLGIEPIYGATKAAMDALTFSLARELGRDSKGITVNSVLPGPVRTDSLPPVPPVEAMIERLVAMTRAEERIGTVEDIADAVLLLASEKSRWITGQCVSVSGGIIGG